MQDLQANLAFERESWSMNIRARMSFAVLILTTIASCGGSNDVSNNTPTVTREPLDKPNLIVFFTDDQGWSDVGFHGIKDDIKTPNIDLLAGSGVHFTNGYITAPQCSPSRAAMHTGNYQQSFGMDQNILVPMPLIVTTIADRFNALGYTTGMVGKWHLDINRLSIEWARENYPSANLNDFAADQIPFDIRKKYFPSNRGYDFVYTGTIGRFWRNFDLNGNTKQLDYTSNSDYRIDVVSDAADAFIRKNAQQPFYLHVAHFGPHVPIEAPEKYLNQFPHDMPTRRRYALASMLAIDDGIGKIIETLTQLKLLENTMIVFISDNGAPIGLDKTDSPIEDSKEQWNGSENIPMRGEKGMLTEGGIRVPFIMSMPGIIQQNSIIDEPVINIDVLATALKLSGGDISELDGVDLLPAFEDQTNYLMERSLFWRFQGQQAIRKGKWKYLEAGDRKYLFDMLTDDPEGQNLINMFPDIADALNVEYKMWSSGLLRPDDPARVSRGMKERYDFHLLPDNKP
jgi:arylsulfatase A-like enzyme